MKGNRDEESLPQLDPPDNKGAEPYRAMTSQSPAQKKLPTADRRNTPPSGGPNRAQAAYRGYFRWLRLSRLAQAAFILLACLFLIWALPWIPRGLDTSDYTPEVAFTVLLIVSVAFTALLYTALREMARRDRESLYLLREFYDEATGLHAQTYLNDRLALQCERADRGSVIFSVLILQIHVIGAASGHASPLPPRDLKKLAELIEQETRSSDLIARLSDAELAVLAADTDETSRGPFLERLRGAAETGLPQLLGRGANASVRCGASTYGKDGTRADVLIQNARTDLMLAARRGKAA